ncbi:unnamed protein product [Arctia plantaginis]|uniref:Dendritic cell-specific transmembrane protein-like domain-containing protein n=1 Tax=Arctia plantaginis TaxID=874455 RepID=A0A8S0ZA16_ARCPL|nr:unnamed protein product [Arctia plantaginis]
MSQRLRVYLEKCLCLFCVPFYRSCFSDCNQQRRLRCADFIWGFALGQIYYYWLLTRVPFPYHIGLIVSVFLSLFLGLCCTVSMQTRCISLLIYPMFCGKAGRGVLKVVVLTYVVAGPITNMGINAREVVRVFACSTQLSYNLSKEEHTLIAEPFRKTALGVHREMDQIKETLRSVSDIVSPIEYEIENTEEIELKREENDYLDKLLGSKCRSRLIEKKYKSLLPLQEDFTHLQLIDKKNIYQNMYKKKFEYRCENLLTHAISTCTEAFDIAYDQCLAALRVNSSLMCRPLKLDHACQIVHIIGSNATCDSTKQTDLGFEEGYIALERAKHELTNNLEDIKLQYKVAYERELYDIQDAKETGERVIHAFEEKITLMGTVAVALNLYVAFLFLRILVAAVNYHDRYLTNIEYDNIYITKYFKQLDERREMRGDMTLLPLKKMERIKYIDVHSMSYKNVEQNTFLAQILKVMLEMVTATTFVMLDRLFYEALDVVRQHAQIDVVQEDSRDVDIEVEGSGILASLFRKLLENISSGGSTQRSFTNKECVPHPRPMPFYYYFKIYGGYLWILLLLYVNPYTLRLRRLACSYFYPKREKQRILHLYNDILKKRMKMQKTLRRRAVQTVRAHYLSGENLLSLRMKFPQLFGWLHVFPAARMTCLICGETEPRTVKAGQESWHPCRVSKCPFLFCGECWREAGGRCLACDPSLVELSDIDSLSEDEHPKY